MTICRQNTTLEYKHGSLLKTKTWAKLEKKDPDFPIRPGEEYTTERLLKFNNAHMDFHFLEVYTANQRKTTNVDYKGFDTTLGIESMHENMIADNAKSNAKFAKIRKKKKEKTCASKLANKAKPGNENKNDR